MWLYGVLLACCGSVFSCTGLNLQRISQVRNAKLPIHRQIPPHKQPLNILGVSFMVLEAVFDLTAYEFSSSSTLAPFSALTLTLNMILAPAISKEKTNVQDFFVSGMVFTGTTIAVRFSNHEPPSLQLSDLIEVLTRPIALICLSIFFCWIVLLSFIVHFFDPSKTYEYEYRQRLIAESDTLELYPGDSMTDEPARFLDHSCFKLLRTRSFLSLVSCSSKLRLHRCALPLLSGSIGACTALLAKSFNELVVVTMNRDNQFRFLGSWLVAALLIVSASVQIKFLNMSLRFYESLWVVPLYTSTFILMTSSFTSMVLGDLEGLRGLHLVGFFFGISLTISGIIILLLKQAEDRTLPALDGPNPSDFN